MGERKRSHTEPLVLLWLPPCELIHEEITAYQIVHLASSYRQHFTFSQCFGDVCTHDHIWFSQRGIPGGGPGSSVLVWLMERMRLREGTWHHEFMTKSTLKNDHFSKQSSLKFWLKCIARVMATRALKMGKREETIKLNVSLYKCFKEMALTPKHTWWTQGLPFNWSH